MKKMKTQNILDLTDNCMQKPEFQLILRDIYGVKVI